MKFNFKLIAFLFSIITILVLASCNPQPETAQPIQTNDDPPPTLAETAVPLAEVAAEPTLVPTNTPSPPEPENIQEPSETTENADASSADDAAGAAGTLVGTNWTANARLIPFDTFVFGFEMKVVNNGGTPQIFGVTVQNSKPLSMTTWTPNVSGMSDQEAMQMNEMRLGVFENSSYMYFPQMGCIWSNEGAGNDEMLAFNTDGFLKFANQPDAQFDGMETVNGLETYAYTIGEETLTTNLPPDAQVQEASGRINLYPLPTGKNLIVRSQMTMISNYDFLNESYGSTAESVVTTFMSEVKSINEPLDIQVPEACAQQAESFSYPIYAGGQIQGSMPGISVLNVPDATLEDVAKWYETELASAGWTISNVLNLGPATNIDMSKDGQNVTVSITQDPSSGDIIVTFIES